MKDNYYVILGESQAQTAARYGVNPRALRDWNKKAFEANGQGVRLVDSKGKLLGYIRYHTDMALYMDEKPKAEAKPAEAKQKAQKPEQKAKAKPTAPKQKAEETATFLKAELKAAKPIPKKPAPKAKDYIILSTDHVTVGHGARVKTFDAGTKEYREAKQMLLSGNINTTPFFEVEEAFAQAITSPNGSVVITEHSVHLNGVPVCGEINEMLVNRIVKAGQTLENETLMKFLERLAENPNTSMFSRLPAFLSYNDIRIDAEGYVIAYKAVKEDYTDIHSGTFDNSVGCVCEMPRENVDDNDEKTCSAGLHVAAYEYAANFSSTRTSRLVRVRIDPKDFVSIPVDYRDQKARVCRYEVIGEIGRDEAPDYGDSLVD